MKSIKFKSTIVIMMGLALIYLSEKDLEANSGFNTPFAGIGFSYEYSWYKNLDDKSGYVTLKYGEFSFISYFLTADIGHRMEDSDFVYRLSGEAYMGPGIFGIHAGISNKYDTGSGDFYDGKSVSYGLTTALAFNPSLFLVAGQEAINSNTRENFVRVSLMYNFRSGIKFRY